MSEVIERYRRIADGFTARVKAVTPEEWSATTPCPEWTVRDLVAHVVGIHRRVIATLDETGPVDVDPEDRLLDQWFEATGEVTRALNDERRASKVIGGMFSEQPFESLVSRLLSTDTLVHTWDLARATGQDERLDAEAVTRSMEFLSSIDEAIRRPGGFAQKIDPPPDADEQTRFLAFCGRTV